MFDKGTKPQEEAMKYMLLIQYGDAARSVGEAITLDQGEVLIFPNKHRLVENKRGHYRVNVRHGVSPCAPVNATPSASSSTTLSSDGEAGSGALVKTIDDLP